MKRIRLCLLFALVLPALLGMPDTYAGGEDALIISTMENLQDPEKQISSFGLSDVIVLKDETAEKNQAAARNALASGKLVVFRCTQIILEFHTEAVVPRILTIWQCRLFKKSMNATYLGTYILLLTVRFPQAAQMPFARTKKFLFNA